MSISTNKKKISVILVILLFCVFISNIQAWQGSNWSISLESNLDFNFGTKAQNERLYDIEYIEGFYNKPLLQVDLSLFSNNWKFLTEGVILSLRPPIILDLHSFFSPMVKLGYLEYDDDFIYFSIGRRKQSIGISDFNLFVNKDMPFYDGINISIGKEKGFRFDSLISVANLSKIHSNPSGHWFTSPFEENNNPMEPFEGQHNKFFMYHALSYVGKSWYLMVGESAILGNPKSIGDLNIFANIHNENSERANVGLEVQFAKTFDSKFMFYGMVGIDDLPTQADHATAGALVDTPSAVALGGGISWKVNKDSPFKYPSHDPNKEIRQNNNFSLDSSDGGLTLSLDYVATSRWFYQRSNEHDSSKEFFNGIQSFYNYFFNPQWKADRDHFSVPFGPKYGGDAQIISLKATNETQKYKLSGIFEIALLGIDARERLIDVNYWGGAEIVTDETKPNYSKKWITSGDIKPLFTADLNFEYGLHDWLTAYTGGRISFSSFTPFKYVVNIGATVSF